MEKRARNDAVWGETEVEPRDSLDDAEYPLRAARPTPRREGAWVGTCTDATHPVLRGRVQVRWDDDAGTQTRWLPTLTSLAVRAGDRVLCTAPTNFDEPVVTGVLDGFSPRPEVPTRAAATLALKGDEHLAITDDAGNALVEVRTGANGLVVKLLHAATTVELPGTLTLRADALALAARTGDVRIEAHGDVRVNGDHIRLNGR
ncbi:MAG: hypothetical protein U0325_29255 [Polyangiales bacterium]